MRSGHHCAGRAARLASRLPMRPPFRSHRWLTRWLPRRRHLRGSWLHRMLGDRLFHHDLWRPSQRGSALGLAVGVFIAFTPTLGVQLILAGLAAYLLRVNIPLALGACFITNPATAVFIYGFEYKLGVWLLGPPEPVDLAGLSHILRNVVTHGKPMWMGSIVCGGVAALISYVLVVSLWSGITRHLRLKH